MKYKFSDIRFQRFVQDARKVEREYGRTVARNLYRRINFIANVTELRDLFEGAGRLHPLTEPRKGDYAFDLSGAMRLIVRFEDNNETVLIISIEDYH